MKQVVVYGPGCAKCRMTEEVVRRAVAESGVAAEVTKVSDLKAMMQAGIMGTPAVAVEGQVMLTGRVPRLEEVVAWIS